MSGPTDPSNRVSRTLSVDNAADAILESFAANGVEFFFNSPGTEFAPLWDQFAAETAPGSDSGFPTSPQGIKYVGCRHEELALHMAMGYAVMTGRPQVVGLHVNVGSLHGAMSIHGAYRARIPMVIVTSHADTHEREVAGGSPGSHYLNFDAPGGFEDHFARYVKWVAHPERTANVTRYLGRAFRIATTQPRGPVLLNLARELLYDETISSARIVRDVSATPPAPSSAVVRQLGEKLSAAANPVIIAGMTGRTPAAVESLVTLAERLRAPVMENPKWQHGFPSDHSLSLGSRAFLSDYLAKDVDLVLVLDSRRPWYPPEADAPPGAEVIMVSPDPAQVQLDYWNYPADLLVTGDPVVTVRELLEVVDEVDEQRPVDWPAEHERLRAHWGGYVASGRDEVPIDPFWLCAELDRLLPADAVLVEETTVHKTLITNLIGTEERSFIGGGLALAGGRGGGLGVSLGARMATPERPVVALLGDGAYNYNPVTAALGAAQEHGLPILAVIFDNSGYRSQMASHARSFPAGRAVQSGTFPGTAIAPRPDYARQADAWNAVGVSVDDPDDIEGAVTTGLESVADGRAAVVHVILEEASPRARLVSPGNDS